MRRWQISKLQQKKSSTQLVTTFSFPGSSPNIKRTFFSWMSPGRLLLKLIYWSKSVQNKYHHLCYKWIPGTIRDNNREIPKQKTMRRVQFQEKLIWIFSRELLGYCHNLQILFWNFSRKIISGQIYCKTALVPQYLLTRMFTH